MKILFVCLGNICRSPLAEAIFNYKISTLGLEESSYSDSCGTSTYNLGDDPDPRTIRSARKNNVPIQHTARQLKISDLDEFDLILAMDSSNLRNILSLGNEKQSHKVKLLRSYDPLGGGDVPDPYYGSEKDFDFVFEVIDRCIEALVQSLDDERLKTGKR